MAIFAQIDFSSHVPYYLQLIEILKSYLISNVWKPGEKIPNEEELCKIYKISRTVVRQALQELEYEGIINRRKGRGTFIAEPKVIEILADKITGFHNDMNELGLCPKSKVLHIRKIHADQKIASFLKIELGDKVISIHRLILNKSIPHQLIASYIPYTICPTLVNVDLTDRSLTEYLEKECSLIIARGHRFIEAVAATSGEARLLHISKGDPLIMLNGVNCLEDGRPIEYYLSYNRGDCSRFFVEMFRSKDYKNNLRTGS